MPLIELIVTGKLEHKALASSLGKFVGSACSIRAAAKRIDGFTSARFPIDPPPKARARVQKVAAHLVAAFDRSAPPDFAVLVDDLELYNLDQPDVVVDAFRDAVNAHLDERYSDAKARERCADKLRERASFHLLKPMAEAYFFAGTAALSAANARLSPHLVAALDIEEFLVDSAFDPAYFAPTGQCATGSRQSSCPWDDSNWKPPLPPSVTKGAAPRALHPKKYVEYLARDDAPRDWCTTYEETTVGAAAMELVDWRALMSAEERCPFARALIEDLFAMSENRWTFTNAPATTPTSLLAARKRRSCTLRNV
jgi:hypothetical protein